MDNKTFVIIVSVVFLSFGMIIALNKHKQENKPIAEIGKEATSQSIKSTVGISPSVAGGPPPMQVDKTKKYRAILKTSVGQIAITLNVKQTPITVNNFVYLARKGFYNKTIFHRVIKGFMIQGGDPKGDGTGGPGYTFADEPFKGDYTRGTVAMANAGPNTNGSQFFIMHQDNPLPKKYVIFGKVTKGMDTVDKIAEAPVKPNPNSGELSSPVNPVVVQSIQIIEK